MKKILTIVVSLVVVLFVAFGFLLSTLDLNTFKAEIVDGLTAATGRKVEILGDIEVKPALTPTLKVAGFKIANPEWAKQRNLVESNEVFVKLAIIPLLRARIEFQRVTINGVRIHLEKDASGQRSWDFDTANDGDKENFSLPALAFKSIEISDFQIQYLEPASQARLLDVAYFSLKQKNAEYLTLKSKLMLNDEPLSVTGELSAFDRISANKDFSFSLNADATQHTASVNGTITEPLNVKALQGGFELRSENLGTLLRIAGIESTLALPFKIDGDFSGKLSTLNVSNLTFEAADSVIAGSARITLSAQRPAIGFQLQSDSIDLDSLLGKTGETPNAKSSRAFPADEIPFRALTSADLDGTVHIKAIKTANYTVSDFQSKVVANSDRFALDETRATLAGGPLSLAIKIATPDEGSPNIDAQIEASKLSLTEIRMENDKAVATSGTLRFNMALTGSGESIAAVMAKSNGHVNLDIANAQLDSTAAGIASGDLLLSVLNGLNPLSKDSANLVECAAIRLPIKNGIAANQSGVGIRTAQLNILGGGQINLASEEIAFKAKPKPRKGIGLNVASLADFVGVGGTIMAPRPATDTKGLATAGVKIGAAFATGGLSLLAEGLFDRASSDVDVCAVARGEKSIEASTSSSTKSQDNVIESTGKKIKGVFKGLFGK